MRVWRRHGQCTDEAYEKYRSVEPYYCFRNLPRRQNRRPNRRRIRTTSSTYRRASAGTTASGS